MENDIAAVFEEGQNFDIKWKDVLTGIIKHNIDCKSLIETLRAEHDELREEHNGLDVTSTRENSLRKNMIMSLDEKQHKDNTDRVKDVTKLNGKFDTNTEGRNTEMTALDSWIKDENESCLTEIENQKNHIESKNEDTKTDIANLDNFLNSEHTSRKEEIVALDKRANDDTEARSLEDKSLKDRIDMEIDDRETFNCNLQNRMESHNDERKTDIDSIKTRMMKDNQFLKSFNGKSLGVYFNAYRNKAYDGGGDEYLSFQGTLCNTVGDALNCRSGMFTCPCGGTYMFQFHIATHDNKKAKLSIHKNGIEIASIFDQNRSDNHKNSMAGQSVIVEVDQGDDIGVFAHTGTWLADTASLHYTHWIGILLKPNQEEMTTMRNIAEESETPLEPGANYCTLL